MKLMSMLVTLFTLAAFNPAFAQQTSRSLELRSAEGVNVYVGYDLKHNQGNKSFERYSEVRHVTIRSGSNLFLQRAEIFLNGQRFELSCNRDGRVCGMPQPFAFHATYEYQRYMMETVRTDWFLSVRVNGRYWLVDPVRNETVFQLMF